MNTSVLPRKNSGLTRSWVSDIEGNFRTDKEIYSYHDFDEVYRRKNDKDKREINQYSDPPIIGRKQK